MAGEATEFSGVVRNLGDVDEDIRLEIEDEPFDWDVDLSDDFFAEVKAKEQRSFTLTVKPPPSALADEVGSVTVRAYIQGMPSIKDRATCHAIVMPNIFIELEIDEPQKYVAPATAPTIW
jgi:hypothetical protein